MPSTLTRDYYQGAAYPANPKYVRIGFDNHLDAATISSAQDQTGFEANALTNPFPYDRWKPASFPATLDIVLPLRQTFDYIAFGSHSLGGCTLTISSSEDGIAYTEITAFNLANDRPAMVMFPPVYSRYVRVLVEADGSEEHLVADFSAQTYTLTSFLGGASLGVLYLGQSLEVPTMIYGGHTPGALNAQHSYVNNTSESGYWLGRTVIRRNINESISLSNLNGLWYRDYFQPFVDHAASLPYFLLWRPLEHADECIFGQTSQTIAPSQVGAGTRVSVSFQVTGIE